VAWTVTVVVILVVTVVVVVPFVPVVVVSMVSIVLVVFEKRHALTLVLKLWTAVRVLENFPTPVFTLVFVVTAVTGAPMMVAVAVRRGGRDCRADYYYGGDGDNGWCQLALEKSL